MRELEDLRALNMSSDGSVTGVLQTLGLPLLSPSDVLLIKVKSFANEGNAAVEMFIAC